MDLFKFIVLLISLPSTFTFSSFNKCTNESNTREGILTKIAVGLFKLSSNYVPPSKMVKSDLDLALAQYKLMAAILSEGVMPRSGLPNGSIWTSGSELWTCGFYEGTLWYLYEYSNAKWASIEASKRMRLIESIQFQTTTHDVGFKMFTSFGHAYKLERNATVKEEYRRILLQSAASLATRFRRVVGCIRSWDWGGARWSYPVIIDNMMNLELLNWASTASGNCTFMEMAISHADHTIVNHFRPNFSSFHVVDYNATNGAIRGKQTYQGYADWSSWARGQAWGLYGFTMMFRYTGLEHYLDQARQIANFILNSPKVPSDGIPFWDYDVPANETAKRKRDASAAAVTASALLELGQHVAEQFELFEAIRYWSMATKIISTLKSAEYRTKLSEGSNFLLKHSVGNFPANTEVDVPIVYADYYFVEALTRYKQLFS